MSRVHLSLLMLAVGATAGLHAQSPAPQKPAVPPRDREITMALAAAPEHLRAGAGVYALDTAGFVRVRESTNGFTCIVNRDHPLSLKPTCYDAEGSATILPKVIQVGAWMMEGKSLQEIAQLVAAGFQSGRFISPRRPGVAYMLSGDIKNVNSRTGEVGSFPPHVMFYAPNLTNADIGSTGDGRDGLPFIAYQGPHGYMIMMPASMPKTPSSGGGVTPPLSSPRQIRGALPEPHGPLGEA